MKRNHTKTKPNLCTRATMGNNERKINNETMGEKIIEITIETTTETQGTEDEEDVPIITEDEEEAVVHGREMRAI